MRPAPEDCEIEPLSPSAIVGFVFIVFVVMFTHVAFMLSCIHARNIRNRLGVQVRGDENV